METLEKLIAALYAEPSDENNKAILIYLRKLCKKNQTILIPVQEDRPLRLTMEQGDNVYVAFTNLKEKELGPSCEVKEESLAEILRLSNVSEAVSGLSINPWGQSYYLPKVYCEMILDDKIWKVKSKSFKAISPLLREIVLSMPPMRLYLVAVG